jgi:RimJ/RimL family protein N-acetyltransferase
MVIPTLETERLVLRAHRADDIEDCAALWGDAWVTRFIGGIPLTREEAWSRLLRYAGHWSLLGFGYWVVEEKATGKFLGEAGFADLRRAIAPPLGDTPEAGWVFASAAHGFGFASEAVGAIHAWGRSHFSTQGAVCLIHPENAASLLLAAKLGYIETGRSEYHGRTAVVLRRDW